MARPKSIEDMKGKELITLDECLVKLQELWQLPAPPYVRRTLQNRISRNEIKRYGPRNMTLVDWNEVRDKELRKRCG
jgi:hypothetical protein